MTRFLDTEDWSDSDEGRRANPSLAPLPSFLREDPLDRAEVTDLTLHFHDAGPSFRPLTPAAAPAGDSTQEIPVEQAPAPAPAPAPALEASAGEPSRDWTPALAYSAFLAAQPHTYEIAPDSYLAEAEPLPPSDTLTPEDLAAAAARGREWDPLVDPWPTDEPQDGIEAALLEHAARERDRGIVPAPAEDAGPERSPFEAVSYQPVVFSPAPYVPEAAPEAASASEESADADDSASRTQPFDLSLQHPSGPLPRTGLWPPAPVVPETPAELTHPAPDEVPASVYDVSLTGPLGTVDLGFTGGHWYSLAGDESRPVTTGEAVRSHPELAGQIIQVVCWWMREHPKTDRALDLATELALAVSEVVRERTGAMR
jgi:hypothetical protein